MSSESESEGNRKGQTPTIRLSSLACGCTRMKTSLAIHSIRSRVSAMLGRRTSKIMVSAPTARQSRMPEAISSADGLSKRREKADCLFVVSVEC